MIKDYYSTLDKIIDEYEIDKCSLASGKEIFIFYPKLFVLSIVSLFEKEIKSLVNNIVTNPTITLPPLSAIVRKYPNKYIDRIYGQLMAYEDGGIVTLKADGFYDIFGGNSFKNNVESCFSSLRVHELGEYQKTLALLKPLIDTSPTYENDYIKNDEIHERFDNLTFLYAETAFLKLKLRRNKVAHNFISGMSDSFEDIRNLFYDAVLYAVALKTTLKSLSTI